MKRNFGMWIFLSSETLLFGSLIFLYLTYYIRYRSYFQIAARQTHLGHGIVNTFILLTSSLLVALAGAKKEKKYTASAIFLGFVFLLIKGHEYYDLTIHGKFPLNFTISEGKEKLFLTFYGYLTFLHSLHVLVGMSFLLLVFFWPKKNPDFESLEEGAGLYWHFVDMVWVFLFPLFYLVRT